MALRDHSLDGKIVDSARAEFLEKGFMKASLHRIASAAGITTGALYTRWSSKDDLFRSLVSEVYEASAEKAGELFGAYMEAREKRDAELMVEAMKAEERAYRDLLFEHYEACVLFFAKSDGSAVGSEVKEMMRRKAEETIGYLRSISGTDRDLDGISMIMASQFRSFREILEKGWDREKAVSAMEIFDIYEEAGWRAIFSSILS